MLNFKNNKPIWIGAIIGFIFMFIGLLGSTPLCNWNPLESSVVRDGLCSYFSFIYIFYFIVGIIWFLPFGLLINIEPIDVTRWTTADYIVREIKYGIPTIIIGTLIGAGIGWIINKTIQKFR